MLGAGGVCSWTLMVSLSVTVTVAPVTAGLGVDDGEPIWAVGLLKDMLPLVALSLLKLP